MVPAPLSSLCPPGPRRGGSSSPASGGTWGRADSEESLLDDVASSLVALRLGVTVAAGVVVLVVPTVSAALALRSHGFLLAVPRYVASVS